MLDPIALEPYPSSAAARERWIAALRPPRNQLDPWKPYAFLVEPEAGSDGLPQAVVTVFLTNRECPWRCLMCDLWRNTLTATVPDGAIAAQIEYALSRLPPPAPGHSALKLYNAGSFFDHRAIPPAEYTAIARLAAPFRRTIVECHPALVGPRCLEFRERLVGALEVAMGLETVHPEVLARLNKHMTLAQFRRASAFLQNEGIDLRVFILVRPPWLTEDEGLEWAKRSLDFAFACGASVCSLIPTRGGNGAMEALAARGDFAPPSLTSLEAALEYGLRSGAGRVFADLWEIEAIPGCPHCSRARIERIISMNMSQHIQSEVACSHCA